MNRWINCKYKSLFYYNRHHGANGNPYNPNHSAGGSSGGSASAIAAGKNSSNITVGSRNSNEVY